VSDKHVMANASIVAVFDEDCAAKLSGVSKTQLAYWCRTRFFIPAHEREGKVAFSRIYSFHDIVALKVLNTLRNQFKVSLRHILT
jgi:DNA-binding transcriptional MerR regulator